MTRGGLAGALLPVFVGLFAAFSPVSIAAAQTSLGLAAACFALDAPSRAAAARLARAHFLRVPVALWCAASIAAAVFAIAPAESATKLNKLLLLALLPLGAAPRVRAALPNIVAALIASTALVSIYGLARHAAAGGGLAARVDGINGAYMTFAGIAMIVALVAACVLGALRAPAALGAEARPRAPAPRRPPAGGSAREAAALVAAAGAAIAAALIASYTRGSWLGFAAGLAVALRRRRALLLAAAAALVVAVALAPPALKDRVRSIADLNHPSNVERMLIWRHGLGLVRAHPWTGVGLLIPARLMEGEVSMPDGSVVRIHSHMHNAYLQIAVSMGIPALAAFVFFVASLFRLGARAARRPQRNAWERGLVAVLPALLAALLVNGLVEWNFGDSEILGVLYLLCGLVLGVEAGDAGEDSIAA